MRSATSLLRNTILQVGGKLFGTFLGLGTFFILVRTYGDVGFGLLTTALTYVSFFSIVVDFGLTLTVAQMISEDKADEEKILGNLLTLRVATALLFLSLPLVLLPLVPGGEVLVGLVTLSVMSAFFGSIAQVFVGVFQKRLEIQAAVWAETANRLVAATVAVLAWWFKLPLWVAAAGFALGALVQLFFMLTSVRSRVRLRPAFDIAVWREIVRQSWPIGVSIIFNLLYLKGDILFMWFFARGAAEIGQYGSAYKVVDVMTMIPVTFMGLLLPQLRQAWTSQERTSFMHLFQRGFDLLIALALPGAMITYLLGPKIMLLLSPDLGLAGELLRVLGPAAAVVFMGALFGHLIVAIGKQHVMTWGYVGVAVVAITLYVLTIPTWGAWGAAWTTLAAEVLIGGATATVVLWTVRPKLKLRVFWGSVWGTAAMAAVLILFREAPVIPLLLLGAGVYAGTLGVTGGLKVKDLLLLVRADRTI
jgi:O-antigen/teichoic acid export membrane protein